MSEEWIKQLKELKELRAEGLLTEEDFERERARLMASRQGGEEWRGEARVGGRVGEYELLEVLGEGGMGVVYLGKHRVKEIGSAQGVRAVKVLKSRGGDAEARFRGEAVKGMRIKSGQLAEVFEFIEAGGELGLVMEYIEGPTLSAREGGSVRGLVEELWPLARFLDELHGQGIVHRDLKPENVKLHPTRGPVLLDFGIAKEQEIELTQTTRAMGTPLYMSPEQVDARRATGASDQYSLALIIYRLATRRFPWGDVSSPGRLAAFKMMDQRLVWSRELGVSEREHEALARGMRRAPEERFRSCVQLFSALLGDVALTQPVGLGVGLGGASSGVSATIDQRGVELLEVELRDVGRAEGGAKVAGGGGGGEEVRGARGRSRVWVWGCVCVALMGVLWGGLAGRVTEYCGDGVVNGWSGAEECDEGETEREECAYGERSCTVCSAECKSVAGQVRYCGDGVVNGGEECDGGSECNAQCQWRGPCGSAAGGCPAIEWVRIPAGVFQMGSEDGESDEKPVHTARLKAFEMSKTEVTVGQYRKCVEAGVCSEPSSCRWGSPNWSSSPGSKEDHPINCVDWSQSRTFAKWVGADLPTEAEWEYAARGGQVFTYAGSNNAEDVGWYTSNSGGGTKPVGTKQANAFGLHDMSGNVREWTLDEYKSDYIGAPSDGHQAVSSLSLYGAAWRVNRGGSWLNGAGYLRVASRNGYSPGVRYGVLGLRLRRTLP